MDLWGILSDLLARDTENQKVLDSALRDAAELGDGYRVATGTAESGARWVAIEPISDTKKPENT